MADLTLDTDFAGALRDLAQLKGAVAELRTEFDRTKKVTQGSLLPDNEARDVVATLNKIQKEYAELQRAAETLRGAQQRAYDPDAIKIYSKALAQAEAGMKQLEGAAKKAGVSLEGVEKKVEDLGKKAEAMGRKNALAKDVTSELFGAFTKATIIVEAIQRVAQFTAEAVTLARQVAKTEKQFAGFTGGLDNARTLLKEVNRTASELVLPESEAQNAAKELLSFGVAAKDIPVALQRIADVAKGTGNEVEKIAQVYAQVKSAGTLTTDSITSLGSAAGPVLAQLSKQLGTTETKVREMAANGTISFSSFEQAFADLTKQGGLFDKASAQNADSIDRLSISFERLKVNIGTAIAPLLDKIVGYFNQVIESANALGESKGIGDFFGKLLDFGIKTTPALSLLIQQIKDLTGTATESVTAQAEIIQKAQSVVDAADIENGRKNEERNAKLVADFLAKQKAANEAAKKASEEAAKRADEIARLRVEALRDGLEKEIAAENLRFSTLESELKKYHLSTEDANFQHLQNISNIKLKFYLEDLQAQAEARAAELESAQRGFEELEKLETDSAAARKAKQKDLADLRSQIADEEAQNFEAGLLNARAAFLAKQRTDEEISKYDEQVAYLRTQFQLAQQKKELEAQLQFNSELSEAEKRGLEARLKNINAQINTTTAEAENKSGGKGFSIYDLLGVNDEKGRELLNQAAAQVVDALNQITEAQVRAAEAAVKAADTRVEQAQRALDAELRFAESGFASDVDLKRKQLAEAQKAQQEAVKQQKAAARQQLIIDAAQQASALAVSAAKVIQGWSGVPFGLGIIPAIAQVASIIAFVAKIKAQSRAIQFRHGGEGQVDANGIIRGPSHEGGGVQVPEYEGGEFFTSDGNRFAVVNKRMTKKHFNLLRAINADDRSAMRSALERITGGPQIDRVATLNWAAGGASSGGSEGFSRRERKGLVGSVQRMERQQRQRLVVTQEGDYTVERRGIHTRRIRNAS